MKPTTVARSVSYLLCTAGFFLLWRIYKDAQAAAWMFYAVIACMVAAFLISLADLCWFYNPDEDDE